MLRVVLARSAGARTSFSAVRTSSAAWMRPLAAMQLPQNPNSQPQRKSWLSTFPTTPMLQPQSAPETQQQQQQQQQPSVPRPPASLRSELPTTSEVASSIKRATLSFLPKVVDFPRKVAVWVVEFVHTLLTDPKQIWARSKVLWGHIKEGAQHYWLGSKLLWRDIQIATRLLRQVLRGHSLTRRERKMLLRTTTDLFRLVPMLMFIVIPFMELLLPVALKLFPNMLPSQFQSDLKKEEGLKKQLKLRIEMARFLQDTVQVMAKDIQAKDGKDSAKKTSAKDLLHMIDAIRLGEAVSNDDLVSTAKLFKDDITLDNIPRAQLVALAQYMGLSPYGSDAFLRFQIRAKIRAIKTDDRQILWEGTHMLSLEELKTACSERGMRATGLTEAGLRRQLDQWLDLSIDKEMPVTLLILSRAFTILAPDPERAIKDSISAFDDEVLNEAVLEAADSKEDVGTLTKLRLESIEFQNELIRGERDDQAMQKAKEAVNEAVKAAEAQAKEFLASNDFDGASMAAVEAATASTVAKAAAAAAVQVIEESQQRLSKMQEAGAFTGPAAGEQFRPEPARPDMAPHSDMRSNTSAPVEPTEATSASVELKSEEAAALQLLAQMSSVEQERAALEKVKTAKLRMDAATRLAKGRIGRPDEDWQDDTNSSMIRSRLERMLENLEDELDSVDRSIGDKLNVLDKDGDGVVSAEELRDVLKTSFAKYNTDETADAIVQLLDKDKDGQVTLDDIVEYAREKAQEEAHRDHRDAESDEELPASRPATPVEEIADSLAADFAANKLKQDKKK